MSGRGEFREKSNEKLEFHCVTDPLVLLPVIKERLPVSCMMYNQVLQFKLFTEEVTFYTVGQQINSDTWILSNYRREDYKNNYSISAPSPIIEGTEAVPAAVKDCFSSNSLLNWDNLGDFIFFVPCPTVITKMIADIAGYEKGNVMEIHPCYLYYMEPVDALKLEINPPPEAEVRRLDASKGESEFIRKTWKYSIPGSELALPKCIYRNASGGVFLKGECVCGVYISAMGFLTALYTVKEHRQKGYAKVTMNYTFKEYAKDGYIPCLTVEIPNKRSIRFHESLGLKVATQVNGILIHKLEVD